ncbi:hypothetical protein EV126DRAFT_432025 [Verticillium dahliae]|nr:hypothetical protein EV126DRAFT_432025 [Verticillium dahliae]
MISFGRIGCRRGVSLVRGPALGLTALSLSLANRLGLNIGFSCRYLLALSSLRVISTVLGYGTLAGRPFESSGSPGEGLRLV